MANSTDSSIPSPVVFANSLEFDGNDGLWSTFAVRVGTPAQLFRVIPIPSSGETYIPIPEACTTEDPSNCAALRGAFDFDGFPSKGFDVNASSTWSNIGTYGLDLGYGLDYYDAAGNYGLETVGIGFPNSGLPSLSSQVVSGIVNKKLWLGMIGLSPVASNFSDFEYPQRAFMTTLMDDGRIPSLSYGYTAGASYRLQRVAGSLTIGGYDQSKFKPSNQAFPFDQDETRPLGINIQRITAGNTWNGTRSMLDKEIYVQLDYTVPHLWLPEETCDRLAKAFGLTYDNRTELYRVNDTMHARLQSTNPTITIAFGATDDPAALLNIELPYGAFDLQASYGFYDNATNYFPIKRAKNETQYVLGRAFLQEAYLVVDYERKNFSLHQALHPASNVKEDIVPILNQKYSDILANQTASKHHPSAQTRRGAITGITVGAIVGLLILIIVNFTFVRWRRRSKATKDGEKDGSRVSDSVEGSDGNSAEMHAHHLYEMHDPNYLEAGGTSRSEIDGILRSELMGSIPPNDEVVQNNTNVQERTENGSSGNVDNFQAERRAENGS
ncbi:aspartic peptidase domain-containing protein [Lophiotrema nucula]|uniref:Aspartic peptidase domain-containing protein n=1 Tax=Lophiotrema nucula TaxID=690887 RepID=A0A6A5YYE6_9PLEO|nr:aspartic peptidase domain-containing protein [Lophiotrema nucula]